MAHREVTHIRRDGSDPDRRIDQLQGKDWGPLSIDEVIADIQLGRHSYGVMAGFWEALIEVKLAASGRYFLQTVPDGRYDNNLYALPEIGQRRLGATLIGGGS